MIQTTISAINCQKACILNRSCVIIRVVYFGWYHNELYRKQVRFAYIVMVINSLEFKFYYPLRSVQWTETGGSVAQTMPFGEVP